MFIVTIVLFVVGLFVLGISFSLPVAQAFVFIGGLALVVIAFAIPMHVGSATRRSTWKS
jgi:hypothetical protein